MTGWRPRLGVQARRQPLLALLPRRLKRRQPTPAQPVQPPLRPGPLSRRAALGLLRLTPLLPRLLAPPLPLPPPLQRLALLLQPQPLPLAPLPRLLLALAQLPLHPSGLLFSLFPG